MAGTTVEIERLVDLLARRRADWAAMAIPDWDPLVSLAVHQGVAPVAWSRLKTAGVVAPAAAEEKLRGGYLATAARNTLLIRELGGILSALQSASVRVIPLKGACLAETVYGNIALRPMGDLDLLVQRDTVPQALDVLRSLGYECESPIDPAAEQTFNHGVPLTAPGRPRLDLHWTVLTPRYHGGFGPDDLEGLWSRAVPATIAGMAVRIFSPADLLLHLCMHLSVDHGFDEVGLRAFVDLDEVSRRYAGVIDWDGFAARANKWGVANGVSLALQLAAEWVGLDLPPRVLPALDARPPDEETVDWVRHKVFNANAAGLQSAAVRSAGSSRFGDHLGLARDAMAPFRAALAGMFRSPAASWRILRVYSVRLAGYLGRHRRALWQIATRDKTFIADARREARLREYLGWR